MILMDEVHKKPKVIIIVNTWNDFNIRVIEQTLSSNNNLTQNYRGLLRYITILELYMTIISFDWKLFQKLPHARKNEQE